MQQAWTTAWLLVVIKWLHVILYAMNQTALVTAIGFMHTCRYYRGG